MASLEIASEATRAGLYTALGVALFKLAETVLRRSGHKHRETLEEIDASLHVGAVMREEQRKRIEQLETRLEKVEAELDRAYQRIETLESALASEQNARKDAEAEVRILKRAQRTPVPPSRPPEPPEKET